MRHEPAKRTISCQRSDASGAFRNQVLTVADPGATPRSWGQVLGLQSRLAGQHAMLLTARAAGDELARREPRRPALDHLARHQLAELHRPGVRARLAHPAGACTSSESRRVRTSTSPWAGSGTGTDVRLRRFADWPRRERPGGSPSSVDPKRRPRKRRRTPPCEDRRMRIGITIPFAGVPLHELPPLVRRIEALGYESVWSAESTELDGFTPLAVAAQHS